MVAAWLVRWHASLRYSGMVGTSKASGQGKQPSRPAPKRPVSPKVYRRRRLVVAILAVIVIAGLAVAGFGIAKLFAPAQDTGISAPAPTPEVSENTEVKAGSPPAAVCDEAGIKVSASMDQQTYAAGETPKLTLKVTNTGKGACDINVGTSQMEFKITSGADVIFNSKHCQADPGDLVKNLQTNASETATFTWKRNRSAEGCAKVPQTPGAGTYVFVATLGKWSSEKVVFNLQ